jgi:hypothetical protein
VKRLLVFVHGRSQQQKDSVALKAEWVDAFEKGLAKSGLKLPLSSADIRFPYYGNTLFDMAGGASADAAAEVVVRGTEGDREREQFIADILNEVREKAEITDAKLAELVGDDVVRRGALNWKWMHGILRAIDRFVPHGSGTSVALFTNDVYRYLRDSAIRERIEAGIVSAFARDAETVVVSHSLGTVIAYNLLRREAALRRWNVPLFVTVGSPLAIGVIRKTLKSFAPTQCPFGVRKWFNAMDERDIVALYPLTPKHFPLNPTEPSIENKTDVRNRTENRHGIEGYLDDPEVAQRIYQAITARREEKKRRRLSSC